MAKTPIEDGAILASFQTKTRKADLQGKPAAEIALREIDAVKGQAIVPLLTELSGYVLGIIESFEPEFT